MKLSPADTATVLKKVKRANAVVKPGLEAATNGKPSPDRESSSHLSSSLESSAELEAQRCASFSSFLSSLFLLLQLLLADQSFLVMRLVLLFNWLCK